MDTQDLFVLSFVQNHKWLCSWQEILLTLTQPTFHVFLGLIPVCVHILTNRGRAENYHRLSPQHGLVVRLP